MKRLWFSIAVVLFLGCASWANVFYLNYLTSSLSSALEVAQSEAEAGNTDFAYRKTLHAGQRFLAHSFYLHITLDHQDIDGIQTSLGEVLEYLRLGETGGVYVATNSELLIKLRLLAEAEQLTLKNIL